jgi:hypothetical protein
MNLDINGSARRLLTTVYCRPRDIACNQPGKYRAQIVPGSPALPPTCATLQSCARLKTRKFDVSCFPSPWYGIPALTRLAACQSSQRRKASESLFGPTDAFDRSCVILDVTTFIERQCVSKVERDRSTSTRWYLVHACASSRRIDPHTSRQPVLSGPHCATLCAFVALTTLRGAPLHARKLGDTPAPMTLSGLIDLKPQAYPARPGKSSRPRSSPCQIRSPRRRCSANIGVPVRRLHLAAVQQATSVKRKPYEAHAPGPPMWPLPDPGATVKGHPQPPENQLRVIGPPISAQCLWRRRATLEELRWTT